MSNEVREYSPSDIPGVYYKKGGNTSPKYQKVNYNGNFHDIKHLTIRERVASGSRNVSEYLVDSSQA